MALEWNSVLEKAVVGAAVGLIVSAVVGVLALLWNWGSQGGLVHVLGGVTQKDLEEIEKRPRMPPGAVVAFDLRDGCPGGWKPFESKYSDYPTVGGNLYTRDLDSTVQSKSKIANKRTEDGTYGSGFADGTYGGSADVYPNAPVPGLKFCRRDGE